jgi:hypothetical protein
MKKLAILAVLAVVLMACTPLYAAMENIDIGGDLEFRGWSIFRENAPDTHFAQSEIYLWVAADLADNVMGKVSLTYRNDFGGSGDPAFRDADTNGNINLHEGYLKLSRVWDYPVSVMVGRWMTEKPNEAGITRAMNRSTKIPVYGEGFIINNNNPVDGIRATLDLEPSWIDFLWYKIVENTINANDDITAYAVYAQTNAVEGHTFDAYALYLDNQGVGPGTLGETGIFGIRADGGFPVVEGLGYKAEIAYSHTHITGPGDEPDGFGGYAGVDYTFPDVIYGPSARLNFYWMEPNFTQPYGHTDQDDIGEVGYGRIFDNNSQANTLTNGNASPGSRGFYFVNVGATIKPAEKWALDGDYYKYNNQQGNSHLGHEIDVRLSYQYTENVAAELIVSYYIAPENPSGAAAAALLGLNDDAILVKGGIKVSF